MPNHDVETLLHPVFDGDQNHPGEKQDVIGIFKYKLLYCEFGHRLAHAVHARALLHAGHIAGANQAIDAALALAPQPTCLVPEIVALEIAIARGDASLITARRDTLAERLPTHGDIEERFHGAVQQLRAARTLGENTAPSQTLALTCATRLDTRLDTTQWSTRLQADTNS